jgi:START-like superfamily domain
MANKSISKKPSKSAAKKKATKSVAVKKNAAKKKPVVKKKVTSSAKKAGAKKAAKAAPKKVVSKKTKPDTKAKAGKNTPKKKVILKPVKSSAKALPDKKKPVNTKQPNVKGIVTATKAKTTLSNPEKAKELKSPKSKGKEAEIPPGKVKIDPDEKFHNKAQRIIKELEETMDMDKVKPRIKVPVYSAPKPKQVFVQKLYEPVKTNKEKIQMEFEFRSSKVILFNYLSDSSGMAEWFADEVRSTDRDFTFVWEGVDVRAKQILFRDQYIVRYEWTDETDGTYFQFEIKEDFITSDIALMITDWVNPSEKASSKRLWESQVQSLRQLLGSH